MTNLGPWYELVLGILAVWRVTYLLHAESGPWDLLARLRQLLAHRMLGALLDCLYCLSFWVAIPFAALIVRLDSGGWKQAALVWPALSAGATLIERFVHHDRAGPARYYEEPEEDEYVLRPKTISRT